MNPRKLTVSNVHAAAAQASILEFNSIIRAKETGYKFAGEELNLATEQHLATHDRSSSRSTSNNLEGM